MIKKFSRITKQQITIPRTASERVSKRMKKKKEEKKIPIPFLFIFSFFFFFATAREIIVQCRIHQKIMFRFIHK